MRCLRICSTSRLRTPASILLSNSSYSSNSRMSLRSGHRLSVFSMNLRKVSAWLAPRVKAGNRVAAGPAPSALQPLLGDLAQKIRLVRDRHGLHVDQHRDELGPEPLVEDLEQDRGLAAPPLAAEHEQTAALLRILEAAADQLELGLTTEEHGPVANGIAHDVGVGADRGECGFRIARAHENREHPPPGRRNARPGGAHECLASRRSRDGRADGRGCSGGAEFTALTSLAGRGLSGCGSASSRPIAAT